jgi:hypothetical protein
MGYLHNSNLDESYSADLSNSQSYIPSDAMDVYIGNSNSKTAGSMSVFFKDVRLWAY